MAQDTATYKLYVHLTLTGGWQEAMAMSMAKVDPSALGCNIMKQFASLCLCWFERFSHTSLFQGATLPGMPNTPVNSVTQRASTTLPCRDMDSPHQYLLASHHIRPCSWPECLLENTQSVILCTADHPPRMPASPTFMTVVWTIWRIQRFMSFLTAIRFTQSIWSSSTDGRREDVLFRRDWVSEKY